MSTHSTSVRYRVNKKFPGYRVGDDGSVWTCHRVGRTSGLTKTWRRRKLIPDGKGYGHLTVTLLRFDGVKKLLYVQRLVLLAFVGPCPEGMEACHFPDRDTSNNHVTNLRWDTHKNNGRDMARHQSLKGVKNGGCKLTELQVADIRECLNIGMTQAVIATKHNITDAMVSRIKCGKAWINQS